MNISLRGETETRNLRGILVDTGAKYTTLRPAVPEQVGAFKASFTMDAELAQRLKVTASLYA